MLSLALRQRCPRTNLDLHGSRLFVKVNFFSSALWRLRFAFSVSQETWFQRCCTVFSLEFCYFSPCLSVSSFGWLRVAFAPRAFIVGNERQRPIKPGKLPTAIPRPYPLLSQPSSLNRDCGELAPHICHFITRFEVIFFFISNFCTFIL